MKEKKFHFIQIVNTKILEFYFIYKFIAVAVNAVAVNAVVVVVVVVATDISTTNGRLENSTFLVLNLNCCHHFDRKILCVRACMCV